MEKSDSLGPRLVARALMGLFGGTRTEIAILNYGMPNHVSCCVPLCTNNFRNSSDVTFYRIPKKQSIRREYVRLLRNTNLKLNSDSTRICSAHWNGGRKLSRSHLPSIFPWSKENNERRILHRKDTTVDSGGKKRKVDLSIVPKWTKYQIPKMRYQFWSAR